MGEAVRHQGFGVFRHVARQRIAHLDRRRQFALALFQYLSDVLARMLPSGKEQRDGPCTNYGSVANFGAGVLIG